MTWRAYVAVVEAVGKFISPAVGAIIRHGPVLSNQKAIRRVARYAGESLVSGGTALMILLIILAPLFGLVAQMTSQERAKFDEMESRMRRVEQIVTKIDDPDGLLRTLNERTKTLERKLSNAELDRVRLESKVDRSNEKLDDIKADFFKWGGVLVAIGLAGVRFSDWLYGKIRDVATTETGEKRPVQ